LRPLCPKKGISFKPEHAARATAREQKPANRTHTGCKKKKTEKTRRGKKTHPEAHGRFFTNAGALCAKQICSSKNLGQIPPNPNKWELTCAPSANKKLIANPFWPARPLRSTDLTANI